MESDLARLVKEKSEADDNISRRSRKMKEANVNLSVALQNSDIIQAKEAQDKVMSATNAICDITAKIAGLSAKIVLKEQEVADLRKEENIIKGKCGDVSKQFQQIM